MPLTEVHLIENVFNLEQKRQIIQELTDAMVSIEGENMRGVTWVKISQVTSGEWGRRPAADRRSRQGSRSRTTGGVRPARGLTSLTRPICDAGLGSHGQLSGSVAAAMQRGPD